MSRFANSALVAALLACQVLGGGVSCAGEERAPADARPGWTRVDAVPAWVKTPPTRAGHLLLVDGAQSNLLKLAYPDPGEPAAARNVRLAVSARLAKVLGPMAQAPAKAAGAGAKALEQIFLYEPPARGKEEVVGGQVYTAFVLWDVPLGPVLAAVPDAFRARAEVALLAPPHGAAPPWVPTPSEPEWALGSRSAQGRLRIVTGRTGGRWDVLEALAKLQSPSAVRSQVQALLRPALGNDAALEIGTLAIGACRLLEQAHATDRSQIWQLWEVDVNDVLALVPESHRTVSHEALLGPVPPRPWNWEDPVEAEPKWASHPPAWPGHVPVVQVRRSDLPELARERSAKLGEKDVARALRSKLESALGAEAAARAADAGSRRRQLVRKAIHDDLPVSSQEAVPGARIVTVWSLWQVPVDVLLEVLPSEQHAVARAALR